MGRSLVSDPPMKFQSLIQIGLNQGGGYLSHVWKWIDYWLSYIKIMGALAFVVAQLQRSALENIDDPLSKQMESQWQAQINKLWTINSIEFHRLSRVSANSLAYLSVDNVGYSGCEACWMSTDDGDDNERERGDRRFEPLWRDALRVKPREWRPIKRPGRTCALPFHLCLILAFIIPDREIYLSLFPNWHFRLTKLDRNLSVIFCSGSPFPGPDSSTSVQFVLDHWTNQLHIKSLWCYSLSSSLFFCIFFCFPYYSHYYSSYYSSCYYYYHYHYYHSSFTVSKHPGDPQTTSPQLGNNYTAIICFER